MIDREEASDLIERDSASNILARISMVFIAFSIVFCAHSIYSIVFYLTDTSVPLVVCPRNFVVDAPVLMKSIRDQSALVQDRWVRGFMRRFVTSQFPRTGNDVVPFFTYVVDHSDGAVKDKFESLLKDKTEVQAFVNSGTFYKFYPKHVDAESPPLRIRATDTPNKWSVDYEGFLVKKMNNIQERYVATLRYTVVADKPTMTNPEGLYVVDGTMEHITDYVSNTKEKL